MKNINNSGTENFTW